MSANEVIEEGLRAWGRGDLDALASVMDPKVTITVADGVVVAMQQFATDSSS